MPHLVLTVQLQNCKQALSRLAEVLSPPTIEELAAFYVRVDQSGAPIDREEGASLFPWTGDAADSNTSRQKLLQSLSRRSSLLASKSSKKVGPETADAEEEAKLTGVAGYFQVTCASIVLSCGLLYKSMRHLYHAQIRLVVSNGEAVKCTLGIVSCLKPILPSSSTQRLAEVPELLEQRMQKGGMGGELHMKAMGRPLCASFVPLIEVHCRQLR